jgi:hypothetical protein
MSDKPKDLTAAAQAGEQDNLEPGWLERDVLVAAKRSAELNAAAQAGEPDLSGKSFTDFAWRDAQWGGHIRTAIRSLPNWYGR